MPFYRCDHEGESFSQEVVLRPFHQFVRNGRRYLLNVEAMTSHLISQEVGESIELLSGDAEAPVSFELMKTLSELGLVGVPDTVSPGDGTKDGLRERVVRHMERMPVEDITLNVTQACNLNCVYCQGDGGTYGQPGLMTEETAFRIVDWFLAQAQGVERPVLGLLGGEPLLNFELVRRIVEYANGEARKSGKEMVYQINTNGLLVDQDVIDFFKEHGIIPCVAFDGPPEIHDANRPFPTGKGSHDAIRRKIAPLLSQIPETEGRATVRNESSYHEVEAGLNDAGFSQYRLCAVGPSNFGNYGFQGEEAIPFANRIPFLQRRADDLVTAVRSRAFPPPVESEITELVVALVQHTKNQYGCKAGWGYLGMDMDGNIFPCNRLVGVSGLKQGNVESDAFERTPYLEPMVRRRPLCRACWARYFCGGGCMFLNLGAAGEVETPFEPFCDFYKAAVELAVVAFHELDQSDVDYLEECLEQRKGPGLSGCKTPSD